MRRPILRDATLWAAPQEEVSVFTFHAEEARSAVSTHAAAALILIRQALEQLLQALVDNIFGLEGGWRGGRWLCAGGGRFGGRGRLRLALE